ncbi:MAG: hypothetical protein LBU80_01695 [Rikenellaceae bacterium]|jgi:hypothetical protein|nr:hypothetical protein [Rikenellaceae bacterium]
MIIISDKIYAAVARRLLENLDDGTSFFNGRVECDTPEGCATLIATLIIYRRNEAAPGRPESAIENIVPVWWEFRLSIDGADAAHDFSWSELKTFLL